MQNPDEEEQPLDRCGWAAGDALLAEYHDREWGVPLRDDHALVAAAAAQEITGLATIEILPV